MIRSKFTALKTIPKFFIMIAASILIALVLVFVSMLLYVKSGAAQLDLSRPDYQAVRKHAQKADLFEGFNSNQPLSSDSIKEFNDLFDKKMHEMDRYKDSFNAAAMSNNELEIRVE